jgi:hypothetical protein
MTGMLLKNINILHKLPYRGILSLMFLSLLVHFFKTKWTLKRENPNLPNVTITDHHFYYSGGLGLSFGHRTGYAEGFVVRSVPPRKLWKGLSYFETDILPNLLLHINLPLNFIQYKKFRKDR